MGKWKIKFPCGLEFEQEGYGIILKRLKERDGLLSYIEKKGCLIHGKKCENHNKGGNLNKNGNDKRRSKGIRAKSND